MFNVLYWRRSVKTLYIKLLLTVFLIRAFDYLIAHVNVDGIYALNIREH